MPVVSQRLTVLPSAFFAMKLASRSAFISLAMRSSASSQRDALPLVAARLARSRDTCRRFGLWTKSSRPAPFGHSVPRLTG